MSVANRTAGEGRPVPAGPAPLPAPVLTTWSDVADAGPAQTGGKAYALARLARYGFPVPPGLSIPAEVQAQWLAASGLADALHAWAAQPDPDAAQGQTLRARLAATPVPPSLQAAWRDAAASQARWLAEAPLAVRSSAPQEDSRQASFAGIHRSCLNVRGEVAAWAAVVEVWCSPWTPAAVAYRRRMGIPDAEAAMAVLVMPLVPAQASGIAFTQDPASGRADRLVIHANWGLGESLVGGESAGDEFVLAIDGQDHPARLVQARTAAKSHAREPEATGGTRLAALTPERRQAACLSVPQAERLAVLLHQAAMALDWEQPAFDLEWAFDGRDFHVLQARPITARARHTYAALQEQPEILSRGNTREVTPYPMQPVDWSATQGVAFAISEAAPATSGFPLLPALPRLAVRDGYLYLNMSLMQWEAWAGFGVTPADFNRLLGGHHGEIRVAPATARDRWRIAGNFLRYLWRIPGLRRRGRREAATVIRRSREMLQEALPEDDAGLARRWREHQAWYARHRGLVVMQGTAGGSLWSLVQLIERYRPGEGHALASALLAGGEPSVTAQQSLDLMALARVARADALAPAWLARLAATAPGTAEETVAADVQALPADNAFRRTLATFLDRYGHRATYETYHRHPRWREAPAYLLRQLPDLMAAEALPARRADAAAQAFERARHALPALQVPHLRLLVRMARQEFNDRERARSAIMSAVEPNRRLLLTQGTRWVARGVLERADDVFFLTWPELLGAMDGVRPVAGLRALVEDRRAVFGEQCAATEIPDVLLEGSGARQAVAETAGSDAVAGEPGVFRGVCVGRGEATGPACILHAPEQGQRLKSGEILVVPSTDPSWTPLFLKVGGLVMETGGFLSHGAIVAREFGIPAVVNVAGILRGVRDGDRLHVDAARATVRRLD